MFGKLWVDELCVWSIMYLKNYGSMNYVLGYVVCLGNCGSMNCVFGLLCVWRVVMDNCVDIEFC